MHYNNFDQNDHSERDLMMIRLKDIEKKLSALEWRVFEIVASNGVSEEKDAKQAVINTLICEGSMCVSEDTAWRSIKSLVKIGLYDTVKMSTGYRNFNILKITDVGEQLYRLRYRKEPPIQEHNLLIKEHASLLHGYMVKDVAQILKKKGVYKVVSTSRKQNLLKLSDDRTLIPDVIGVREDGYIDCFEVECGNHHQSDFNAKCSKLIALGKVIIIGQNRDRVTRILKPQVENWIKSLGKERLRRSGITVYLYSITDFAKKQITYYYDMATDEPVCCFKKERKEDKGNE